MKTQDNLLKFNKMDKYVLKLFINQFQKDLSFGKGNGINITYIKQRKLKLMHHIHSFIHENKI